MKILCCVVWIFLGHELLPQIKSDKRPQGIGWASVNNSKMNLEHGGEVWVDSDFRRHEYQEESPRQLVALGEDWISWHSTLPVNAFCRPSRSGPFFYSPRFCAVVFFYSALRWTILVLFCTAKRTIIIWSFCISSITEKFNIAVSALNLVVEKLWMTTNNLL